MIKSKTRYSPLLIILSAILGLFVVSCNTDLFQFDKLSTDNWEPDIAFPVFYGDFTANELIDQFGGDDAITADESKLITLIYEGVVLSKTAGELLPPPQVEFDFNAPIGVSFPIIPEGFMQSVVLEQEIDFDIGVNGTLDSALLKAGIFMVDFSSDIRHHLDLEIVFPQVYKDGQALTITENLNYEGNVPVTLYKEYDVQGYKIDMSDNVVDNILIAEIKATLTGTGNPLEETESISVEANFDKLEYEAIFGDFNEVSYPPIGDSIDIDFFKNLEFIKELYLVDPSVKMVLSSSIGLPLHAFFSKLQGVNTQSGATLDFAANADIPNPIIFPYPTISEYATVATKELEFSSESILELLNEKPKIFVYEMKPYVVENTGGTSFIIDTSIFKADLKVVLPMHGTAVVENLSDTIDFSFDKPEEIKNATISMITNNGFPIDFFMQAYMLDEYGEIIDSLFNSTFLIPAALTDNEGIVNAATKNSTDIDLNELKLSNMVNAKKLMVTLSGNTEDSGMKDVKIKNDYSFGFKIGARAQLKPF